MNNDVIVEKLKVMLGINDNFKTTLLEIIVEDVIDFISRYTKNDDLECEPLVRRIALIRYNTNGNEGISTETYNGITQSFFNELPSDIKNELYDMRKVRF